MSLTRISVFVIVMIILFGTVGYFIFDLYKQEGRLQNQIDIDRSIFNIYRSEQTDKPQAQGILKTMCVESAAESFLTNVSIQCASTAISKLAEDRCYAMTFDEAMSYSKYVKGIDPKDPYSNYLSEYNAEVSSCDQK